MLPLSVEDLNHNLKKRHVTQVKKNVITKTDFREKLKTTVLSLVNTEMQDFKNI